MASKEVKIPIGYLSEYKFSLVILLAIFLNFPLNMIGSFFFQSGIDKSFVAFLETLQAAVVSIPMVAFFGWIIWVPIALIALVIGMPIWIVAIKFLIGKGLSPRWAVFLASLLVVLVTSLFSDVVLAIVSDSSFSIVLVTVFAASAAIVASVSTQFLYGFDR